MSHLPPELSISSHHYAAQQGGGGRGFSQFSGLQHSPLGRTVSDSHTKIRNSSETSGSSLTRRKLESEDSSYDSDHECLAGTMSVSLEPLSLSSSQMSKSHDDVTRTYSETLGQVRNSEMILSCATREKTSLIIKQAVHFKFTASRFLLYPHSLSFIYISRSLQNMSPLANPSNLMLHFLKTMLITIFLRRLTVKN